MTSARLTQSAIAAALNATSWPDGWPPLAQVAAALAGYPVAALAIATEPPALWEEARGVDPGDLAPKLLITLDTPDAKAAMVALEQAFAAHLAATLAPSHCESTFQGSAWTLDWAAEPDAESDGGYYQVEYDPGYYGGPYTGVGTLAYVPAARAAALGLAAAFQEATGYAPTHIIHYAPDARYTADGTPLE